MTAALCGLLAMHLAAALIDTRMASHRMAVEEFTLPAHPNTGKVRGDCVGQPSGLWKCTIERRLEHKKVTSIPVWPECSGDCID